MPQGFSFDGDTAAHASLKKAVLEKEAQKQAAKQAAERERHKSLGFPEEEKKGFWDKHRKKDVDPEQKKTIGEKIANFVFNGGRSEKFEKWQEQRGPSGEFR